MEKKCCTFAGHRTAPYSVENELMPVLCDLIENKGVTAFYVGNHGAFDRICAGAVRELKGNYKDRKIELILVLPKMNTTVNRQGEYFKDGYDDVLIPAESDEAHYKAAITVRNKWMVSHSDYIITYLRREHGGAYTTVQYAKKQAIEIIAL